MQLIIILESFVFFIYDIYGYGYGLLNIYFNHRIKTEASHISQSYKRN